MDKGEDSGFLNPYLAGSLTGLLIILSVWIAGKYFGASTSFVRSSGMIEALFSPERVSRMDYFLKELPQIDWQWMFVVGIFFGALISSKTSGSFQWKALPDMWEGHFGKSRTKRALVAFTGGVIAMFGARLADG